MCSTRLVQAMHMPVAQQQHLDAAGAPARATTAQLGSAGPALAPGSRRDREEGIDNGTKQLAGPWGFLSHPTAADCRGKRRRVLALDAPRKPFDHLVVLDFEWTCCNRRKMEPHAEIIEFPSVLLQLRPGTQRVPAGAEVVSEFQTYVRPRHNPLLTPFCKELTAISQDDVDSGVSLAEALVMHTRWLEEHGVNASLDRDSGTVSFSGPTACVVTWTDVDVLTTLHTQTVSEEIELPPLFRQGWIDLKKAFVSHFHREPRGGLQRCVESLGWVSEVSPLARISTSKLPSPARRTLAPTHCSSTTLTSTFHRCRCRYNHNHYIHSTCAPSSPTHLPTHAPPPPLHLCSLKFEGRAHSGLVDSINTAKIAARMASEGHKFVRVTRGFDRTGTPHGKKSRLQRESEATSTSTSDSLQ
jgi:inhibitor of KinA sporulation pathway (predicted exonuclease)